MKFIVMRHGRTDYNDRHLLQGQTEMPLNEKGIHEAENAREELKQEGYSIDRVISSPLGRALKTAEIVSGFPKDKIEIDDLLIEIGFGPMEGSSTTEIGEEMQIFFKDPPRYVPPQGAESYQSLLDRMKAFLESHVQEKSNDTVLVLSHGTAMHAMYLVLTGRPLKQFWDSPIGNCGFFVIDNSSGSWKIIDEHKHGEAWVSYVK